MAKRAHWTQVAKALGKRYKLDWSGSKDAYRNLRDSATRKPSIRMVSALPAKIPKQLKEKKEAGAKPAKKQKTENYELPKGFAFAPNIPRPEPAEIPKRQGARNQFERILKDFGLPVAAIARNETGKQVSKGWRDRGSQEKLGKLLKQGYNQVSKNGYMAKQTVERIADLLYSAFGIDSKNPMWNNILRQLYGQRPK